MQTMPDADLPQLDLEEIKRLIPHRYPFLYIDRVINTVPRKSAVGIKNVTANEPFFQGHFPKKPVLPGVIIIEAMAQAASVLVGYSTNLADTDALVYFMSIDKARFRRMVGPGDRLELHVEVVREGSKIWKFKGIGKVDGETAAEAEFMAMIDVETADA